MARPSWDETFLTVASVLADRSTCKRAKVGCVITKDNRIVSTGYNGSIHGHEHCTEDDCCLNEQGRCIRTIHAEQNALLHAKEDLYGTTAYVTHEPCETCTKLLAQAGIKKVIYAKSYPNQYNKLFNKDLEWIHYQTKE
ncbi:deoxycytidylate deaminase [Bacillus sp. FJAT-45350]|uniref:deoxycytidylate deaminase n=1 Tax=Bacillus sp. FJAT-45350 TaxID=2011014 RepID=UPI000BB7A66A|nr:cytidine/deoxycytidylate deaminase family protein [Bacillus sp. FJAT-45350]